MNRGKVHRQRIVLEAIRAGYRTRAELMQHTGLDKSAIGTAITRLRDAGQITQANRHSRINQPVYEKRPFLLGACWK